ncbi:MAG: DNA polymerase III subunit alpha [Deferribacteres bacterium]|nr:DNA polymerase III subunit alpha [candidate division KSB1 bacterium]MCB9509294.1 DNA polymerase III subunit alpha [Deferribacteres bacterium]
MSNFIHLHNHSHYSLLDGACRIDDLVKAAVANDMEALALTDHGVMFGAVEFYQKCTKAGIKPILGVEAYIAPRSRKDKTLRREDVGDTNFHLLLLAKNERGYKNLMYMVSMGFLEGFYYRPRIDKELLREYHEGIICSSACLQGEVAYRSVHLGYEAGRDAAREYREIFGDDYYLEVHNHGIPEEAQASEMVFEIGKELDIPVLVTNDIHYLKREHSLPHDILICLQTGKDRDDPNRLRYTTDEIYFKTETEMAKLFPDRPDIVSLTKEVADKCNLAIDFDTIHLPKFELPAEDKHLNLDEYLEKLAKIELINRYGEPSKEIYERLDYELQVIHKTGYAGYFLIVWDFIRAAREMKIPVGPGRGSAAGSLVAYCLGITNIDPIKYNLLFERFLNPERVTMPDIDIDFCYEQREKVIEYVRQKYGENNVTQIITFGTMAARAVIRDVGRVLKISYGEVDKVAKMIPATLGIKLKDAIETVQELRDMADADETYHQLLDYSQVLEGLARHASTHAAGVVITPTELTNYAPLFKSPSTGDVTTQYDMKCLEATGVLKMDFLGLRTLTVIDHTLRALKARGVDLDIDNIPLDDPDTYKLFGEGETTAIFQFESSGMREYLRKLKPQTISDLIAMNALYRPGPMDMIDDFIARKHGKQKIEYAHPRIEPILEETYGIIVYQEQVMQIASAMGGFSLGKSDLLRRAMGKKKADLMAEMRKEFIKGALELNIERKVAEEVFDLMDKFARYGFNKSHSACYSVVAYQTAYLKAHYPAEFMAATMTSEMGSTDRIVFFIEECRRMDIEVLPPDVNESFAHFTVVDDKIRFGLGAVKNVGRNAIESIVSARNTNGQFSTIFDFCENIDLRLANKKVLESLIQAGAMDSLEGNRNQLLAIIDTATSYASSLAQSRARNQASLFDDAPEEMRIEPTLPDLPDWEISEKLTREKDVLGFYVSGHPLDPHRAEIQAFSTISLASTDSMRDGAAACVCGMITAVKIHYDRRNRPMAFFTIENFTGSIELLAFSDPFSQFKELITPDSIVVAQGKLSVREEEKPKMLIDKIYTLSEAWQSMTRSFFLSFEAKELDDMKIQRVNQIIRTNPGQCQLYFQIKSDGDKKAYRSRKYRVRPNQDMLSRLQDLLGKENVWFDASPPRQ